MYLKKTLAAAVCMAMLAATACQQSSEPAVESTPAAKVESPAPVTPPPAPKFVRPTFDASAVDANLVKGACFVAAINSDPAPERFEAKEGSKLALEGWTADADFNVPESVALVIRSSAAAYEYPATLGPDRFRAAEMLKKPQLVNAGYLAELDLSGVQPGDYSVFIRQTSAGSSKYCLIDKRQIAVGG